MNVKSEVFLDKMNFKLNPSALNLMQECPRCFWLTQHKVWKKAINLLNSDCPTKSCEWCEGR